MFRFQKLQAWHRAMDWTERVYEATASFPNDERFGLTAQVRRSAVSVASNIAEGSGRRSDRDFARFLEISYGSLMEAISQCLLAQRLGYLSADDLADLEAAAEELARMLSGLRNSITDAAGVRDSDLEAGYLESDA